MVITLYLENLEINLAILNSIILSRFLNNFYPQFHLKLLSLYWQKTSFLIFILILNFLILTLLLFKVKQFINQYIFFMELFYPLFIFNKFKTKKNIL